MAKRAPVGEKPYNPVEEALVRTVWLGEKSEGTAVEQAQGPQQAVTLLQASVAEKTDNGTDNGTKIVAIPRPERAVRAPTHALARGKQAREKRVLLSHAEERQIEFLVHRLALELSTPVKLSHVLRACVVLLQYAEYEIIERARRAAPLTRPPNGSSEAIEEFEHQLAQILLEALRKASPLH